jgi:hypothetical protein
MLQEDTNQILDLALNRVEWLEQRNRQLEKERDRLNYLFSYALKELGSTLKIRNKLAFDCEPIPYEVLRNDYELTIIFKSHESHNATPTQTKTALEAEKGNETDS